LAFSGAQVIQQFFLRRDSYYVPHGADVGYIKRNESNSLKARRYGYLPTNFPSLEQLLESNNESRFTATR